MSKHVLHYFKLIGLIGLIGSVISSSLLLAQDLQNDSPSLLEKIELLKQGAEQATQEFIHKKSFDFVRRGLRTLFKVNPEPIEQLSVRKGSGFHPDEIAAVRQRRLKSAQALKRILGKNLDLQSTPDIGIVASGGGDRAMISSVGFLVGLEKTGLLDACTHFAALSGSTWTACTWLARNVRPTQLKEFMRKHEVTDELKLKNRNFDEIAKALMQKFVHDQHISLCDIWGSFLADVFFEDLPREEQEIYLSQFRELIKDGSYPFLLGTAIHDDTYPYEWAEFSPIESGSEYLGAWAPAQGFGKEFLNGVTTDPAPELPLGFMMGMFGSAYAVNMKETLREIVPGIEEAVKKIISKVPVPLPFAQPFTQFFFKNINEFLQEQKHRLVIDDLRVSPPKIYNFARSIKDIPLSKKKHLTLLDAGLDFNLPFPPLLRRKVPLYFVCDASAGEIGIPLKKAEAYARRKGLKFPTVDLTTIQTEKVSLLYDQNDPEVPVVVYIPNRVKFSTAKFEYTDEEFVKLSGYMEQALVENKDTFIQAIQIALSNKRRLVKRQQAIIQIDQPEK